MNFKKKALTFNKNVNRDVVLCRTTNRKAMRCTTEALNDASISYSKNWIHIPFYRRNQFHGADEIFEISVNRNEYASARRSISHIDPIYRRRLVLNVV